MEVGLPGGQGEAGEVFVVPQPARVASAVASPAPRQAQVSDGGREEAVAALPAELGRASRPELRAPMPGPALGRTSDT